MPDDVGPATPDPSEPPAERLASRIDAGRPAAPSALSSALHELGEVDLAVYRAIAATSTPTLDEPLRRLSNLANNSKLWFLIAGGLFVVGGRAGRRAALTGAAAIAINSAVVNLPLKWAGGRARPDWEAAGVPAGRRVVMPTSPSFPSGHTASGFAFATGVAHTIPGLAPPLRLLAAAVGYSRVHTGVHYPGDVVVGALIGTSIGEATARLARALPLGP